MGEQVKTTSIGKGEFKFKCYVDFIRSVDIFSCYEMSCSPYEHSIVYPFAITLYTVR